MSRTRSIGRILSDGLTNADQHPTYLQRVIEIDQAAAATGRFLWPTGVTAGLQGNSPHCVVLEILTIGHAVNFVHLTGAMSADVGWNSAAMKVRTEPRIASIVNSEEDHIYHQTATRSFGIRATDELTAVSTSNTENTETYADQGHGILIAAPALLFYVKSESDNTAHAIFQLSYHMTYRYRTIPFHQFRKLFQEQTSRSRLL